MKKDKAKAWFKKHKGIFLVGGIGILTLIIWSLLRGEEQSLFIHEETIPENNNCLTHCTVVPIPNGYPSTQCCERISHSVSSHVRNLPAGWTASDYKVETAAIHGYDLKPGQTWVESYRTGN